jgi:Carboxypeptidase regulatory-like domain
MKRKKKPKTGTIRKSVPSPASLIAFLTCFSLLTINVPCEGRQAPKPKTALIFGTVWGPDDRPLAGVTVKIRRAGEKKARWEVYSNRRGEFEQEVPPGKQDYVIWADVKGYKLQNGRHLQPSPEVTVHIESNERADTGLHLQ